MTERKFTEEHLLGMARRAYEEGNAQFDILSEKSALLVIDMQDEFVKPHWTFFCFRSRWKSVSTYNRKNASSAISPIEERILS